jgi:drug/metabolite transporter (DMT)-like permease
MRMMRKAGSCPCVTSTRSYTADMGKVDGDESKAAQRLRRRPWYFVVMGLVAGAAVVAFGALEQPFATVVLVVAIAIATAFDRVSRRIVPPPFSGRQRPGAVVYLVVLGAVLVISLVLAWTVGRDGAPWLPWVLGVIVFVVALVGAWIPESRSARQPVVSQ